MPETLVRHLEGSRGEDPAPGMARANVSAWDTCPRCGAFVYGYPSWSLCFYELFSRYWR